MASKLAPRSVCGHNSNEDGFEIGGVGGKGGCTKVRWNTVRQGEIWINGLFCEQEFYMSNGNYGSINSEGACESCINGHSEADWISNQIAFQELICSESSGDVSDLQTVKAEFARDEHDLDILSTFTAVAAAFGEWCSLEAQFSDGGIEKSGKLKKDKPREWVFIDDFRSGSSKVMDGFDTFSQQDGLLHTNWSDGDYAWNGLKKEDQYRLCHEFIDRGFVAGEPLGVFEADLQNNWLPDLAAQKFSQEDRKSYKKHTSDDICQRRLEEELQGKQLYQPQCDKGLVDGVCTSNEHIIGIASFLLSVEDQRDAKRLFEDVHFAGGHALYTDRKSSASRYGFVCEGEARITSGEGPVLPLTHIRENLSAEAQEELLMADVSFRGDDFSSLEDGNKLWIMPAEALFYALSYMNLKEILSLERVCKSFRDWVRSDILLWQQLHVEPPLSKSFTDEALLQLASRSKGQLRCLSLVDCLRVTEAAVEQVVYSNPRISKLCLPGCSRVSAEAVMRMVKTLTDCRASGVPYLKQLRIRNIYGLTTEHLNCLKAMLGEGEQLDIGSRMPQFYHNGHYSFSCDDQRQIDVETCPKCSNVRLVYDCTRERCQQRRGNKFRECRACILCIVRCEECGRCINDNDYEETFCLDLLCSSCWLRLPKCSECNRPGCGRHADHFIRTPETTFICSDCCGSSPGPSGPEFHVYA